MSTRLPGFGLSKPVSELIQLCVNCMMLDVVEQSCSIYFWKITVDVSSTNPSTTVT